MAKHARTRRHPRRVLFVLFLAVCICYLLWGNTAVQTTESEYTLSALPAGFDGVRIVHLSDLHCREFGENNRDLYRAVSDAQPELIFLTGDLVDETAQHPVEYARMVGAALADIAPTYFVTGNHEWSLGNRTVEQIKSALREVGVTVLSNEFVPLERGKSVLLLAGIDDPNGYADQERPPEVAADLYRACGDNAFWLLLAHRNNLFNGYYCRLGADLTFSGHAHGGIWRLPFTDGLVDTNLHLFPSFTSGFYHCTDEDCEGAEVFVSRGLGNSPPWAFRLFNRPQVAVITLKKG